MAGPLPPRAATVADAGAIADIHCAAWWETYSDLLPKAEIARASDPDRRRAQWHAALQAPDQRIAIIDGCGFACMGPQRDAGLLDQGYPDELYAIYLLRKAQGQGLGAALLRPLIQGPFTLVVLAGNDRAIGFYRHLGARLLTERPETIGTTPVVDLVFGCTPPPEA